MIGTGVFAWCVVAVVLDAATLRRAIDHLTARDGAGEESTRARVVDMAGLTMGWGLVPAAAILPVALAGWAT